MTRCRVKGDCSHLSTAALIGRRFRYRSAPGALTYCGVIDERGRLYHRMRSHRGTSELLLTCDRTLKEHGLVLIERIKVKT